MLCNDGFYNKQPHPSVFLAGTICEKAVKYVGNILFGYSGSVVFYEYDFGSTTELRITFLHPVSRPKQRKAVRLLARNLPLLFECGQCGEAADYVCCECDAMEEYPFFCEKCMASHEHEGCALPVVNSPRMGVCAYCGEYDVYEYSDGTEKEG